MNEFEFSYPSWDEPRGSGLPGSPLVEDEARGDLVEDEAPNYLFEPTIELAVIAAIGQPVPLPPLQCPLGEECPMHENGL